MIDPKRRIVATALLLHVRGQEIIITSPPPARHGCLLNAVCQSFPESEYGGEAQGFILDTGEYIRREPAMTLALENGQFTDDEPRSKWLFSEDLFGRDGKFFCETGIKGLDYWRLGAKK